MKRRPDDFDESDEQALWEEFQGCTCTMQAIDYGCPHCTEEQFTLWWIRRQAGRKDRFNRNDVV